MATKNIENLKIGDKVESFLRKSSGAKIAVRGVIKEVAGGFGRKTYILTKGMVDDFPTRTIKKVK